MATSKIEIDKANWSGQKAEIKFDDKRNILTVPDIGKFKIKQVSGKDLAEIGVTEYDVIGTADSDFNGTVMFKVTGMVFRGKLEYSASKYDMSREGTDKAVVAAQMLYNIV